MRGEKRNKLGEKRAEVEAYFKGDDVIQLVYLFGSAANRESIGDFDFGVYLDELSAKDRFNKSLEISASLSAILDTDAVDVIVMNDAPMRLNFEIINGKNLFCRDKSKRLDLESLKEIKEDYVLRSTIESVYEHLVEDLDDLEEFMRVVSRYVSRKS